MSFSNIKTWDETYSAVVLTFVVFGLLFILKFQDEKLALSKENNIITTDDITLVTFAE